MRLSSSWQTTFGQLLRYGLSGVAINLGLYLLYLLIAAYALPPLGAATVVFAIGIPISLFVHGRVSFRTRAHSPMGVVLFWGAYIVGYAVQISVLALLHHGLGIAHPVAQLIAMVIVALTLFIIQKKLVFKV